VTSYLFKRYQFSSIDNYYISTVERRVISYIALTLYPPMSTPMDIKETGAKKLTKREIQEL
jgi:hypothetical protein